MSEFGSGGLNSGAAYFALGKIVAILNILGCDIAESYVRKDLADPTLFRWYVRTAAPAPAFVPEMLAQVGHVKAFNP